jgi:hypothetical protein
MADTKIIWPDAYQYATGMSAFEFRVMLRSVSEIAHLYEIRIILIKCNNFTSHINPCFLFLIHA